MSSVLIDQTSGRGSFKNNQQTNRTAQTMAHPRRLALCSFCSYSGTFASDCLEARLDAGNGAAGAACFTLQKVESCVFLQDRFRRSTRVTRYIFLCTTAHHRHSQLHTHNRLTALFPGLPSEPVPERKKPIWILLRQETVNGSGISWAVCKSAPRSRHQHPTTFTTTVLLIRHVSFVRM